MKGSFYFLYTCFLWKKKPGSRTLLYTSLIIVLLLQVLDDPAEDNLHMGMQTRFSSPLSLTHVLPAVGDHYVPLTLLTQI